MFKLAEKMRGAFRSHFQKHKEVNAPTPVGSKKTSLQEKVLRGEPSGLVFWYDDSMRAWRCQNPGKADCCNNVVVNDSDVISYYNKNRRYDAIGYDCVEKIYLFKCQVAVIDSFGVVCREDGFYNEHKSNYRQWVHRETGRVVFATKDLVAVIGQIPREEMSYLEVCLVARLCAKKYGVAKYA